MGKINFTPEHMERMKVLLLDMLLNNSVIISGFGNELNACTLLHTTTINNLNNELYEKQQSLVSISSKVERLSGEKDLIKERSKYNSDDIKLHDNIISLKEISSI